MNNAAVSNLYKFDVVNNGKVSRRKNYTLSFMEDQKIGFHKEFRNDFAKNYLYFKKNIFI